ncbi:TetR/AcrR family transcriptional regulator [Enemella sp. A6]|uniref:TetR/AcrR family transcriptional regulator n=1 Tax=Enemella sp. A6 TaxID=3440152 RepID=UPI003EBCBCE3
MSSAKEAMIDAAERLIAERGLAALTLKDVQIEAKQSNKSAAQYHFGSKRGLLAAVVESRMEPVNDRRLKILNGWDEQGITPSPRQTVEAMIGPLAAETVAKPGSYYARFLQQAITDPALSDLFEESLQAESLRRITKIMAVHAPVEGPTAKLRVSALMTLIMVTLARHEGEHSYPADNDRLVADLVEVALAALTAPQAETTTNVLATLAGQPEGNQ